ncbi:MAG: hypothetical protein GX883_09805 [Firmicutes bacterium]|nr:hypothetical protein [Bacillota bacterium]
MSKKSIKIDAMLQTLSVALPEFKRVTNNFNELSFYWGAVTAAEELARQGFLTERQGKMISHSVVRALKGKR